MNFRHLATFIGSLTPEELTLSYVTALQAAAAVCFYWNLFISLIWTAFKKKKKERQEKKKYHRLQWTPHIFVVAVGEFYSCGGAGEKYYHLPHAGQ